MELAFFSASPSDTLEIADALGRALVPGDVVALTGELGAGKTVFCKGVGRALGIAPDRILSPTFTIVSEHQGRLLLRHIDVYRLGSEREASDTGLDELWADDAVCLVEWAEKIESLLPNACIKVRFHISKDDRRRIEIRAGDETRFHDFVSRCERFIPGGDT